MDNCVIESGTSIHLPLFMIQPAEECCDRLDSCDIISHIHSSLEHIQMLNSFSRIQANDCDSAADHLVTRNQYSAALNHDAVEACCGRLDWVGTTNIQLPSPMMQLKHAVADLTGLALVLVCQPQKTVQLDYYRLALYYRQISSL